MNVEHLYPYDYKTIITLLKKNYPLFSQVFYKVFNICDIHPSCLHVYSERLLHAERSLFLCRKFNIKPGEPYIEIYDNGEQHIVVSPIIEYREGKLLLCDGMHRIFTMRKAGIQKVFCIIVYDSPLPLAGKINSWDNVSIEDRQLPVKENFIDYNPNGLTGYSKFCNSDFFWRR